MITRLRTHTSQERRGVREGVLLEARVGRWRFELDASCCPRSSRKRTERLGSKTTTKPLALKFVAKHATNFMKFEQTVGVEGGAA